MSDYIVSLSVLPAAVPIYAKRNLEHANRESLLFRILPYESTSFRPSLYLIFKTLRCVRRVARRCAIAET